MNVSRFISGRLSFKNSIAMAVIAVSYLVMLIAVAVSFGFRSEIRSELSEISGDVQLTPPNLNVLDGSRPICAHPSYLSAVESVDGVESVTSVVYKAGIVKQGDNIHGVLFKGVPKGNAGRRWDDSLSLAVSIPVRMSQIGGFSAGDRMTAYFIGEKVRVRQFRIADIHNPLVEADDKIVVYAALEDLQRLDGWTEDQVSAIEITLNEDHKDEYSINAATQHIGAIVNAYSSDSDSPVVATSSVSKYSQLFDWLNLIDFNMLFILLLMTIVAGVNMISSLLILLFENISKIGLLKSMGMTDRDISKVFIYRASRLVFQGMLIGNAVALIFCMIQDRTHLLKLDPANYFVSFVPVEIDLAAVLCADIVSFVVILAFMLVPTLFISKVDPAKIVRVK